MQEALFAVELPTPASWVYLIGTPGKSVAKIGKADNVEHRLRGIQTSNPDPLKALWRVPGGRPLELALHHEFKAIRLTGEWFDFGDKDPVEEFRAALGRVAPGVEGWADKRPLTYTLAPADNDPQRHDPRFQADNFGCRFLTRMEKGAAGLDQDSNTFFCFCGLMETHS